MSRGEHKQFVRLSVSLTAGNARYFPCRSYGFEKNGCCGGIKVERTVMLSKQTRNKETAAKRTSRLCTYMLPVGKASSTKVHQLHTKPRPETDLLAN